MTPIARTSEKRQRDASPETEQTVRTRSEATNGHPRKISQRVSESESTAEATNGHVEQADRFPDTRSTESRSTASTTNGPTRSLLCPVQFCGFVEELRLVNFMCHKNLRVELGSRINFITGPNGSGKSAILTALMVGLGARASVTNRAASIKGLANDPSQPILLQIRISNKGVNPFQYDKYGDSILIERKISSTISSLSIKASNGRTVSTRKSDLDCLKDHMNIQIDNPCAIMSQDTSRDFLKANTKAERYVFYMKAMQLDQIQKWLDETQDKINLAKDLTQAKKQSLISLEEKVKKYEQQSKEIETFSRLKSDIESMEAEYAWALVHEVQKEITEIEALKEDFQSKINAVDAELTKVQAFSASENSHRSDFDKEAEEIKGRLASARKEMADCDEMTTRIARQKSEREGMMKRRAEEINEKNREIEKLAAAVRQSEKNQSLLEQKRAKAAENIIRTQADIDEKDTELHLAQEETRKLEDSRPDVQTQDAEIRGELNRINENLQRTQRQKDAITRDGQRKEYMIHDKMPQLLSEIKSREREFRQPPQGPIGLHVSLTRSEYAVAVFSCISSAIASFVVNSFEDENTLKRIASRIGIRVNTIIMDFDQVYDIPPVQSHPGCVSVISLLKIENHVIRNALIDLCKIERMCICDDYRLADDIVRRRRIFPEVLLRDGRKCSIKGSTFLVQPAPSQVPLSAILNDTASAIRSLSDELARLMTHKVDLEKRQSLLINAQRDWKRQHEQSIVKQKAIQNDRFRLLNVLNELKSAQDDPVDSRRQDFTNRIKDIESDISNMKEDIHRIEGEVANLNAEITNRKREREEIRRKTAAISEENDKLMKKLDEMQQKEVDIASRIARYTQDKARFMQSLERCKQQEEQRLQDRETKTQNAMLLSSEQIRPSASSKAIKENIIVKKRRLETESRSRSVDYNIGQKYQEAVAHYKRTKASILASEAFCQLQQEKLKQRIDRVDKFKVQNGRISSHRFGRLLKSKGATGYLVFDHKNEELDIKINPTAESFLNKQEGQNVKSVSGGERSFTTVSYLLSLWECIDSPFLSMDEFDIYMDEGTRTVAMNLIVDLARKHTSQRQYIFISPLDTSFVKPAEDIKILLLEPPRRS